MKASKRGTRTGAGVRVVGLAPCSAPCIAHGDRTTY